MSLRPSPGPKGWPAWLCALRRGLSFGVRVLVGCIDTLAEWMESQVFRGIRVVLTFGLIAFFVKRVSTHSAGTGLTTFEFDHYGRAALAVLMIGACVSVLWSGALCDGLAGVLMALIDDPDDRPIKEDPMDKLDRLVRAGRIKRARGMCRRMLRRKEGSRMALETLLIHLSERPEGAPALVLQKERVRGGK